MARRKRRKKPARRSRQDPCANARKSANASGPVTVVLPPPPEVVNDSSECKADCVLPASVLVCILILGIMKGVGRMTAADFVEKVSDRASTGTLNSDPQRSDLLWFFMSLLAIVILLLGAIMVLRKKVIIKDNRTVEQYKEFLQAHSNLLSGSKVHSNNGFANTSKKNTVGVEKSTPTGKLLECFKTGVVMTATRSDAPVAPTMEAITLSKQSTVAASPRPPGTISIADADVHLIESAKTIQHDLLSYCERLRHALEQVLSPSELSLLECCWQGLQSEGGKERGKRDRCKNRSVVVFLKQDIRQLRRLNKKIGVLIKKTSSMIGREVAAVNKKRLVQQLDSVINSLISALSQVADCSGLTSAGWDKAWCVQKHPIELAMKIFFYILESMQKDRQFSSASDNALFEKNFPQEAVAEPCVKNKKDEAAVICSARSVAARDTQEPEKNSANSKQCQGAVPVHSKLNAAAAEFHMSTTRVNWNESGPNITGQSYRLVQLDHAPIEFLPKFYQPTPIQPQRPDVVAMNFSVDLVAFVRGVKKNSSSLYLKGLQCGYPKRPFQDMDLVACHSSAHYGALLGILKGLAARYNFKVTVVYQEPNGRYINAVFCHQQGQSIDMKISSESEYDILMASNICLTASGLRPLSVCSERDCLLLAAPVLVVPVGCCVGEYLELRAQALRLRKLELTDYYYDQVVSPLLIESTNDGVLNRQKKLFCFLMKLLARHDVWSKRVIDSIVVLIDVIPSETLVDCYFLAYIGRHYLPRLQEALLNVAGQNESPISLRFKQVLSKMNAAPGKKKESVSTVDSNHTLFVCDAHEGEPHKTADAAVESRHTSPI